MPHLNKTKPSRRKARTEGAKFRKSHDARYRRKAREQGTYGVSDLTTEPPK
jgi:hypothetical protein